MKTSGFYNEDILAGWYRGHFKGALHRANRWLNDPETAFDIAQDSFVWMYENFDRFIYFNDNSFRTFLDMKIDYACINRYHQRSGKRKKADFVDISLLENHLSDRSYENRIACILPNPELKNWIEQLPRKDWKILKYHYLGDFSYQDIARGMDINEETVRKRLERKTK